MKYRTLGKTGLKVSEIGFGAWGIGAGMWGSANDEESLKTLRRAFDLGVNFYDTAWVYGDATRNGKSEKLIGQMIKEVGRGNIIVASKVPPKNFEWPALPSVPVDEVFPKDWIIEKVNDSLSRLGIETIDLMQFHVWQDSFSEGEEWRRVIQDLTNQGKVKFWGISVNDYQPVNCLKALETGLISTIQFIFNIFHQEPEKELLPFCRKNNIGLIARVPLDEGGLTGKITPETVFNDWRDEFFRGERKREVYQRNQKLLGLLDGEAKSLPELALRWILSHNETSTVIPGMRRVDHAQANAAIADGRRLSPGLMQEIKKHVWERNFYS